MTVSSVVLFILDGSRVAAMVARTQIVAENPTFLIGVATVRALLCPGLERT
jgi:hypothetical protein